MGKIRRTGKRRSTARRSNARRSTARRSKARRSTARRSNGRRSTARRTTTRRTNARRSTISGGNASLIANTSRMGPKAKGEKVLKIKNSYNKLMKTMMTNIDKKHFMQAVTAAVNLENEFQEYEKLYPKNEVIPTIINNIKQVGNILNDYDTTLKNVETNPTKAIKESDPLTYTDVIEQVKELVKEVFESFNKILEGNTDMAQVQQKPAVEAAQQKMHEEAKRSRAAQEQEKYMAMMKRMEEEERREDEERRRAADKQKQNAAQKQVVIQPTASGPQKDKHDVKGMSAPKVTKFGSPLTQVPPPTSSENSIGGPPLTQVTPPTSIPTSIE